MGYAGGDKLNPTYHSLGDHSETIQLDFDPALISYTDLLDIFWQGHNPTRQASRQYRSAIFVHDEQQAATARESSEREAIRRNASIATRVEPYTDFWMAEDYHQKFSLQHHRDFLTHYRLIYPSFADFVDSTAVARLNGYLGGCGTLGAFKAEVDSYGLPPVAQVELREIVNDFLR